MTVSFDDMSIFLSITFFVLALVFFSLSWAHRNLHALPFWAASFALLFASTVMMHLRGANPTLIMLISPNLMIGYGYFLGLMGLRLMRSSRVGWTFPIITLSFFVLSLLIVITYSNTPSNRIAAVSLGIALFSLCFATTALNNFGKISVLGDLLIIKTFGVNAVVAVLRAGAAVGPAGFLPLSSLAVEQLFFLWSLALPVSAGIAFFLYFQKAVEARIIQRVREITNLRDELKDSLAEQEGLKQILIHELRRPLNQIATTLEAQTIGSGGTLGPEHVARLRRLMNGASAVLDEIADLIDLRQLIENPDRRVVPIAELGEDISVKWAVKVDIPVTQVTGHAFVDPLLFDAAVGNVVVNGLRHGKVCRVLLKESNSHFVVEIIDGGPGIEPGDWERVWDQFTQLEAPADRGSGRIGVGLWLARKITRAHDGNALVVSQSPSIFQLTFKKKESI